MFGTWQKLHHYPSLLGINITGSTIPLSDKIKTLGVTLDSHLSLNSYTSAVCKSAFYHIRALRHIRKSLTDDMARAVAVSLVPSRLDYVNSLSLASQKPTLARIVLRRHSCCPMQVAVV